MSEDCDYHSPIDLAPIGIPIGVKSISENGNYNPNLIWINKIQKIFICVYISCYVRIVMYELLCTNLFQFHLQSPLVLRH